MTDITIAIIPRERFSVSGRVLRALFNCTKIPFRLIIVDTNTPTKYLEQMKTAINGYKCVEFIYVNHYLTPNASKNLAIKATNTKYVVLLENDIEVSPHWLERLIEACKVENSDVVRPMIMMRKCGRLTPHFDSKVGGIEVITDSRGIKGYKFRPTHHPKYDIGSSRRITQTMESHCLLFKKDIFDKIGLFNEELMSRDFLDLALKLYQSNISVVFEPSAVVTFLSPPPVKKEERDFYYFIWDIDRVKQSYESLINYWNIIDFPAAISFVNERHYHTSYFKFLPIRNFLPINLVNFFQTPSSIQFKN
jgi:Predicted glycosyltransferases